MSIYFISQAQLPDGRRYETYQASQNLSNDINIDYYVAVEWSLSESECDSSYFGYGITTNGDGWTWQPLPFYEAGDGGTSICTTIVTVTIPGKYYYAFKIESVDNGGTSYSFGDNIVMEQNSATLSALSWSIIGAVSADIGSWSSTSTWEGNAVPVDTSHVAIMHNVNITGSTAEADTVYVYASKILTLNADLNSGNVIINGDVIVNDGYFGDVGNKLKIKSSGTLTIKPGGKVSVGSTTENNGSFTIESSSSGTGSFIPTGAISGTNAGAIIVQRYLTDNSWHMVTPSTNPVTVEDFHWNDNPESWLISHSESTNLWTYETDLATDLNVGKGYMVWLDDNKKDPATATMTGNLQTDNLVLTITDNGNGQNVVGNPFSSAIDWDQGSWDKSNLATSTVYVWDNDYNSGDYRAWNGSEGDLTDGVVPIGQGFAVDADGVSSPALTIPADARLHSTQAFYKKVNNIESPYIRLQLDCESNGNTVFVGFPEHGTDQLDRISGDGRKFYSSNDKPQFFAVENKIELCVNANKPLTEGESKIVPLHLVQIVDGEYTLTFTDLDQLENISITLEDIKTSVTQDLRKFPVYTFGASSNDTPERFLLHFAWSPDGIGEGFEQASNIKIYSYGKAVYIRSIDEAVNHNGLVTIYDLMGSELLNRPLERAELVRIPLNISNNYVIVKVVKENTISTTKVILN